MKKEIFTEKEKNSWYRGQLLALKRVKMEISECPIGEVLWKIEEEIKRLEKKLKLTR